MLPDHVRGRVFAFEFAALTLTQAISTLWAGVATDRLGLSLQQVFFSAGLASIAMWGLWMLFQAYVHRTAALTVVAIREPVTVMETETERETGT
jgi:hypothetical protein